MQKKILLFVFAFVAIGFCAFAFWPSEKPLVEEVSSVTSVAPKKLVFPGGEVSLEIVDTPALREKGLSGRTGLPAGTGMLFVFEESGLQGFWMKDMLFSIDMLWLDSNYRVVHIEADASPDSYPKVFLSKEPARFVLEVPAGWSKEKGIEVGSEFKME